MSCCFHLAAFLTNEVDYFDNIETITQMPVAINGFSNITIFTGIKKSVSFTPMKTVDVLQPPAVIAFAAQGYFLICRMAKITGDKKMTTGI